jgi:hypothetical protein
VTDKKLWRIVHHYVMTSMSKLDLSGMKTWLSSGLLWPISLDAPGTPSRTVPGLLYFFSFF